MNIETTTIKGLAVITPRKMEDERGYFFESFRANLFESHQIPNHFVQENQSKSGYGVIRGLHYQTGDQAQGKLIRVVTGTIWDVAVDIRPGSETYGEVFGIELNDENCRQLWIPKGFAHGFSVLSDTAIIQYKCDAYYAPASESGIRWDDPTLAIDWRIPTGQEQLSEKDRNHPAFGAHVPIFTL